MLYTDYPQVLKISNYKHQIHPSSAPGGLRTGKFQYQNSNFKTSSSWSAEVCGLRRIHSEWRNLYV